MGTLIADLATRPSKHLVIARHPFLERRQLAALLGVSETHAGQVVRRLSASGWIRSIPSGDVSPDTLGRCHHRPRPLLLFDLTTAGRREAARRLLLPAGIAARHHGLLGNGASRRRFFRHLAHTLGANAVFVAFVSAARRMTERGGDEALEEWRSAAACARGRFLPDGYGCYRHGASRFGFFVEFDRGTEKPREHAIKLATYFNYRASGAYKRDYEGFPALLVVTTSELAEARFALAAYLARQRHGGMPLPIFLTTTTRIQVDPAGVLGAIWRGPGPTAQVDARARVAWLPGRRTGMMRRSREVASPDLMVPTLDFRRLEEIRAHSH